MSSVSSDLDTFIDSFFGEGNDLDKFQIINGNTPISKCVQAWLKDYQSNHRVIILPRQKGRILYWYAITFSETDYRDIREQLVAFVGHSYSMIQEEQLSLDVNDKIESAIIDYINPGSKVIRFISAQDESGRRQIIDNLDLMLHIYQETS